MWNREKRFIHFPVSLAPWISRHETDTHLVDYSSNLTSAMINDEILLSVIDTIDDVAVWI
jgi:hypothetical protein